MASEDSDETRRVFAIERSHRDADISNENLRATAQASILINGGAATAILAFLAKDNIDVGLYRTAPFILFGYAVGVFGGLLAMYCSIRIADEYQMRWRLEGHPEANRSPEHHRLRANFWWKWMRAAFFGSMLAFLIASAAIAIAFLKSDVPVKVIVPHSPSTAAS